MVLIFYILAAILVYFSLKSYLGGAAYLQYFRLELAKPSSNFTPFATIISPCKGHDHGLKENLSALLKQDYPNYEVIFVIDDENDPAADVIRKHLETAEHQAKLVVAPKATESSQKVENLREAVLDADPASDVFVFVDSDARPANRWLRALVAPLVNETIGAATGYRWFFADRPSFAAELRSVWNASIASALGPKLNSNFCWGGSMAIRRDLFEKLKMRERWHGTVSDDFTVTRAIRSAGLNICFVPQALTPSIENCTFRQMLEFTNRQMKITRVYGPQYWAISYFGSAVFNVTMIWAVLLTFTATVYSVTFFWALATVVLVSLFSIGKSYVRWKAVKLALIDHTKEIDKQFWPQNILWLFAPMIFLANCITATFSQRINWRGTVYEMVSPTETRIANQTRFSDKPPTKVI